jgi:ferredoxin-fold anticodon binding domain-containing protein
MQSSSKQILKSDKNQDNLSVLVFEKNILNEINQADIMIKIIEDQKGKLKAWAQKMIEKQEKLLGKILNYKHQLKQEISQRLFLEKLLSDLQQENSTHSLKPSDAIYPKVSHEEVLMNTNKFLKKVKENDLIFEIFSSKTNEDSYLSFLHSFRLDQAYIKLIQFICELIDCTSNIKQ